MAPQLPVERFLLLGYRIMPMLLTPGAHFLETAPEPLAHRPDVDREFPSPAAFADVRESKKIEGGRLPPTRR